MSHVRQQIREAAVADLTGLATTGDNVFTSRVTPLGSGEMPGMFVMLRDEQAGLEGESIGRMTRRGQLVIEAWAEGGDGLEDTLDTIAAEVEGAIYAADGELLGKLLNIEAPTTQIDLPDDDRGSKRRIGVVRILVPVTYRTAIEDPTCLI